MALYRFSVKHRSRQTATAPSAQHVAYIMRDGEYGPAQSYVHYIARQSEKVHAREDLVHTEAHNLPTWAHESPAAFCAAADRYERANGRTGTTWEVMLPRELTRDQQMTTARTLDGIAAERRPLTLPNTGLPWSASAPVTRGEDAGR